MPEMVFDDGDSWQCESVSFNDRGNLAKCDVGYREKTASVKSIDEIR